MKIEKLTKEQEEDFDIFVANAITESNGGDISYNEEIVSSFIDFLYDRKNVPFNVCKSPEDMFRVAATYGYEKKKGDTFDYLGMGYDKGWTAFYEYMEKIGVDFSDIPEWAQWKQINKSGIWTTLLFENRAFVCQRPSKVLTNPDGNLHCTTGKAIEWIDGTGYYYLNGIGMKEKHILTPAEKLDVKEIINEKNVDVRRELIRKIGIERFVQNSEAKILDKQGEYELLSIQLSEDVMDARYLKMKNPSIGIYHIEGVEGNTVQEALNWRAGNKDEFWLPVILT